MHLVVDHVLQALVVGGSEEDERFQRAAGEAAVHTLKALALVAQVVQLLQSNTKTLEAEQHSVRWTCAVSTDRSIC